MARELKFGDIALGSLVCRLGVDEAGYAWKTDLEPEDPEWDGRNTRPAFWWLVPRTRRAADAAYGSVTPLKTRELHRAFASLDTSPAAIRKFASRYGLLRRESIPLRRRLGGRELVAYGESLLDWQSQILQMRVLLELWDRANLGDADWLSTFVEWSHDPLAVRLVTVTSYGRLDREITRRVRRGELPRQFRYLALPDRRHEELPDGKRAALAQGRHGEVSEIIIADSRRRSNAWLLEKMREGDSINPVKWHVQNQVNRALASETNLQVFPFQDGSLHITCRSLKAALYALFALEISDPDQRRPPAVSCARPGCGNYFPLRHRRQKFCSPACRKLNHYHRHKASSETGGAKP